MDPEPMVNPGTNRIVDLIIDEVARAKIRELLTVEEKPSQSTKVLRHPLTATLLGFVLTGVLGVLITDRIQARSEHNRHEASLRETRRVEALTLADSVSSNLSKGLQLWDRHYLHLTTENLDTVNTSRTQILLYKNELEASRPVIAARLCVMFGDSVAKIWADSISRNQIRTVVHLLLLRRRVFDSHGVRRDDSIWRDRSLQYYWQEYKHRQAVYVFMYDLHDRALAGQLRDSTTAKYPTRNRACKDLVVSIPDSLLPDNFLDTIRVR